MFEMHPIGHVVSERTDPEDDNWGGTEACIELIPQIELDALNGIEEFSHAIVVYYFDRVDPIRISRGSRHPRNNPAWPRVGIFAQRGKNRPNRIGTSVVRILRREGRCLYVAELDAIDNTPVLDIKPVMQEFLPRGEVRQPQWSHELMESYWRHAGQLQEASLGDEG
jgi:tRNA-Thr(GGU) m(6)t(6)A37 methyltransferase TsaA